MRPYALDKNAALVLLQLYLDTAKHYKSLKNCNQFYIAKKIKEDFSNLENGIGHHTAIHSQEIERLSKKYNFHEYQIHNIWVYIARSSPAAIVQMCKRVRNRYITR